MAVDLFIFGQMVYIAESAAKFEHSTIAASRSFVKFEISTSLTLFWIVSVCWLFIVDPRGRLEAGGGEWCCFGSRTLFFLCEKGRFIASERGKPRGGEASRLFWVRFLLVCTKETYFSVITECCVLVNGGSGISRSTTTSVVYWSTERSGISRSTKKSVVYW